MLSFTLQSEGRRDGYLVYLFSHVVSDLKKRKKRKMLERLLFSQEVVYIGKTILEATPVTSVPGRLADTNQIYLRASGIQKLLEWNHLAIQLVENQEGSLLRLGPSDSSVERHLCQGEESAGDTCQGGIEDMLLDASSHLEEVHAPLLDFPLFESLDWGGLDEMPETSSSLCRSSQGTTDPEAEVEAESEAEYEAESSTTIAEPSPLPSHSSTLADKHKRVHLKTHFLLWCPYCSKEKSKTSESFRKHMKKNHPEISWQDAFRRSSFQTLLRHPPSGLSVCLR